MKTKAPRKLTVCKSRYNLKYSCITLQGKWLTEWGFKPGDLIEVEFKNKSLILRNKGNKFKQN